MKPEAKFWSMLSRQIPPYAHSQRIENTTENGTPDLHVFMDGVDLWIELKICDGVNVYLRKHQKVWAERRRIAGGISFVLAYNAVSKAIWVYYTPILAQKVDEEWQIILTPPNQIIQARDIHKTFDTLIAYAKSFRSPRD